MEQICKKGFLYYGDVTEYTFLMLVINQVF